MPDNPEYIQAGLDAQKAVASNTQSFTLAAEADFDADPEEDDFEVYSWTPSVTGVLSAKLVGDTGADRLIPCVAGVRYFDRIETITGDDSTCGAVILFGGV